MPAALPTAPPQPAHDTRAALHHYLRSYRRGDVRGQSLLLAELREQPDELLLWELKAGEFPVESRELLLDELGAPHRLQVRSPEMQHELCAEVLEHHLYFTSHGPGTEGTSGADRAQRAARLFTWAVAPLARDERHQHRLLELMNVMSLNPDHATRGNWLQQSILKPPNGQIPDLPKEVWRLLLENALTRNSRPQHAAPPVPQSVPSPHNAPAPASPSVKTRITGHGSAGLLLMSGLGFIAVVVIFVIAWAVT